MTVDLLRRQQGFACNDIQVTPSTAQVASFESPPLILCGQRPLSITAYLVSYNTDEKTERL